MDSVPAHDGRNPPDGPRHLPPGQGTLDWPAVPRALQGIDYGGPPILELAHVEGYAAVLESHSYVQRILTGVALTDT